MDLWHSYDKSVYAPALMSHILQVYSYIIYEVKWDNCLFAWINNSSSSIVVHLLRNMVIKFRVDKIWHSISSLVFQSRPMMYPMCSTWTTFSFASIKSSTSHILSTGTVSLHCTYPFSINTFIVIFLNIIGRTLY